MTRRAATKTYSNFLGGLVTEANELSYPENAAIDIDNLDINENGSVQRRSGMSFDGVGLGNVFSSFNSINDIATGIYKWEAVNGIPNRDIAVVQIGNRLTFYYVSDDLLSNPATVLPVTLFPHSTAEPSLAEQVEQDRIEVASGGGKLYVTGKYIEPQVLEFSEPNIEGGTGFVNREYLNLKIRDFEIFGEGRTRTIDGTEYDLSGKNRQTNYVAPEHFYNLANQGWPYDTDAQGFVQDADAWVMSGQSVTASAFLNPAAQTCDLEVDFFPSIIDLYHTYQNGGGTTVRQQRAFSPWALEGEYQGNTPSPRGHFIKDAFNIERKANSVVSDPSKLPDPSPFAPYSQIDESVTAEYRPSSVAFYAGRVWYAGMEGARYTNNVYFSQVVGDDPNKAAKCYQEADPTAEEINELVATDGGVLGLEEVGKIFNLIPIGSSLVVVAENGVWAISGEGEISSLKGS